MNKHIMDDLEKGDLWYVRHVGGAQAITGRDDANVSLTYLLQKPS